MTNPAGDRDRCVALLRQWRLLVALRERPQGLQELAAMLGVSDRTVRRDIHALQRVPFPIKGRYDPRRQGVRREDRQVWSIEPMTEWPADQPSPTALLPHEDGV